MKGEREKGMSDFVLSLFLYFPQDKTEYIPAVITTIIFLIAAIITMKLVIRFSQKEAERTKALEEKLIKKYENREFE